MDDKFQGSSHDLDLSINDIKIIEVALKQFKNQREYEGKTTTAIDNLVSRIQSYITEWDCEA